MDLVAVEHQMRAQILLRVPVGLLKNPAGHPSFRQDLWYRFGRVGQPPMPSRPFQGLQASQEEQETWRGLALVSQVEER